MPNVVGRTWEYWTMRVEQAGLLPRTKARGSARREKPGKRKRRA